MKLGLFCGIVILAGAITDGTMAQNQNTLGQCSPAIASVKGSVNVTCITGDHRIRLARFESQLDRDRGKEFDSFLLLNDGNIVFIKTQTEAAEGLYINPNSVPGPDKQYAHLQIKEDIACKDEFYICGGSEVYFNEFGKEPVIRWSHGFYDINGYYLVRFAGGGQGIYEFYLKPIDSETILLSSKYE